MKDPFADLVSEHNTDDPFADIVESHTSSVHIKDVADKNSLPQIWNAKIKGGNVSAIYNEDAGGFVVPNENGLSLIVRHPTGELDLTPVTDKTLAANKMKRLAKTAGQALVQGAIKDVGAITRGVAGLPIAAEQLVASGYNAIAPEAIQIAPQNMPANAFEYGMNRTFGEPDIASRAVEGATSMLTGSQAAKMASSTLSKGGQAKTTVSRVLNQLSKGSAAQQAAAGAGSGAASEKAKELGYGTGGQVAAGLAGGLTTTIPRAALNTVKLALRGKEGNIPAMSARQSALQNATDMTPTVGQVTAGRMVPTKIEAITAKIPGIGDKMRIKGEQQLNAPTQKAIKLADDLSTTKDAQQAGGLIEKSIKGDSTNNPLAFNQHVAKNFKQLQDETAKYVKHDDGMPIGKTLTTLRSFTTPTEGAIETSSGVMNPKLVAIMKDFESDLGLTQKTAKFPVEKTSVTPPSKKQSFDFSQGARTESVHGATKTTTTGSVERNVVGPASKESMPYSTLRALRTQIGDLAASPETISRIPKAQLMRVYGAISDDIRDGLKSKYGENSSAVRAFDRENKYWSAVKARQETALDSAIAKKTPEEIFRYATDPKHLTDGSTRIGTIMRSIKDPAVKDAVSSVFLKKIAGKDLGDFAKTWQSMHPRAKLIMFPGLSKENIRILDDAAASHALIHKAEDTGMILHKTGDVGIRSKRLLNWLKTPSSVTDEQLNTSLLSALYGATRSGNRKSEANQ